MKNQSQAARFVVGLTGALLIALASASAQTIPNPSFEANSFTVWPGYVDDNGGIIDGWTYTGIQRVGLNPASGSPFASNGATPDGTNVAFVQSAFGNSGSLATTITGLTTGVTYRVSFRANARVDGGIVAPNPSWSLNGGAFTAFTASPAVDAQGVFTNPYYTNSGTFTATSTTAALVILNNTFGDSAVLVDDFRIVPVWSVTPWTDDATSGISPTETLWAYNLGTAEAATLNGVNVPGIAGGNPSVAGQFTVTGIPNVFNNHTNFLTALGGTGSALIAGDFIWGGDPGTVTVHGLTLGQTYTLTFLGVGFDPSPTTRVSVLSSGADAHAVDEDVFGQDNGIRVDYTFQATATDRAITLAPTNAFTFHLYGLALRSATPGVITQPATGLGSTTATLNGSVNPANQAATAWFEWGATTNYGNFTPTNTLPATNVFLAVSQNLTGLTVDTTYHYRAVARNASGLTYGANQTFITLAFAHVPIAGLPGVYFSSVAWGDYDNDGRLDFLLTGLVDGSSPISQLWRNTGSTFTNVPIAGLPVVTDSSVAWGDYDNDGRLDFLLTGTSDFTHGISQLWRNTGSTFTNVPIANLPGVSLSSVAWGDYDNDGRLDFLLTGSPDGGFTGVSQLWRNTGSGFTNVAIAGLPGVYTSSVAWGDYDNDGRLDFLLTGQVNGSIPISQLWRNTGGGFTHVPIAGLPGVYLSSVAWGDYDNDGRLDFLLTGLGVSQLRRNTGSGFTHVPIANLPAAYTSSVAWGDYDNDARLDFLLTGRDGGGISFSQLWRNTGGGFTYVPIANLPGVVVPSVAWADYDNDGRLDFLLTGLSRRSSVSQLWRNNTPVTNTPPGAPTGLAMTATTNAVMLSWNSATDGQTPATGLTYNVRAGSTPGGMDLFAGHVDASNGFRRVPAMGNALLRHSLPLTGLANGQTVYWSVQAVDTSFAGGPFATETSVVTVPTLTINSQPSTINLSWTPPTWGWVLQESTNPTTDGWSNSASGELNPASVLATNAASFYRLTRP